MKLTDQRSAFLVKIDELATRYGKTADQVYGWWREYSEQCRVFDQSPALVEFENWYQGKLKGE